MGRLEFVGCDGRSKDFVKNCRLLDIDLVRRVGAIHREKYLQYNLLDKINEVSEDRSVYRLA